MPELKRRNIIKVAMAYLALSWMVLQVADVIIPALNLSPTLISIIVYTGIAGFPLALILAWMYELTPTGIKKSDDVEIEQSISSLTGRKLNFFIIGALLTAVIFLVIDRTYFNETKIVASDDAIEMGIPVNSIAVLPFVNMSSDPEQSYFSDGISEEILNVLAKSPDLLVTSRSSAFQYRGNNIDIPTVAANLGVGNILEGSVRKAGNRIRITAQLIDAVTDKHLWSETYDRELTDIFAIQDEISKAIVIAIKDKLGIEYLPSSENISVLTTNVEAYDFYLRGIALINDGYDSAQYETAISFLDQAIILDPKFAAGHAGLCKARMKLYFISSDPLILKNAENSCTVAQSFDSEQIEVKLALAELNITHGNYNEAMLLIEEVLAIEPNSYSATTLVAELNDVIDNIPDAIKAYKRSIELKPNDWKAYSSYGGFLFDKKRFEEALEIYKKSLLQSPNNPKILNNIGSTEFNLGQFSQGAETLQQALQYGRRGIVYSNIGAMYYFDHNFAKAVEMYKAAILIEPDYLWNWEGLHASLRFLGGQDDEIEDALNKAIYYAEESVKVNPNNALNLTILGTLYTRAGNYERGRELVEAGLVIDSSDGEILFFAALEATEVNDYNRAFSLLERSINAGYPEHIISAEPALDRLRELDGF